MKHHVFGIHVTHRVENIPAVQATLTKFGCNIRTRVGIHDTDNTSCSPSGLILVDVIGAEAEIEEFYRELAGLKGVEPSAYGLHPGVTVPVAGPPVEVQGEWAPPKRRQKQKTSQDGVGGGEGFAKHYFGARRLCAKTVVGRYGAGRGEES